MKKEYILIANPNRDKTTVCPLCGKVNSFGETMGNCTHFLEVVDCGRVKYFYRTTLDNGKKRSKV